jgi:carbon-monoxide dehydrogenase medium subunit
LALGGVGDTVLRAAGVEDMLADQPLTPELVRRAAAEVEARVDPFGDFRGSGAYRKAMAGVLLGRALEKVRLASG